LSSPTFISALLPPRTCRYGITVITKQILLRYPEVFREVCSPAQRSMKARLQCCPSHVMAPHSRRLMQNTAWILN
jgi:hypothetical protein